MNPFALCSARVCTSDGVRPAAVVIDGQCIVAIESVDSLSSNINILDIGQMVISPGIIDTHVHINEPGTDWEGFETATKAAAAGGITTVIDMPLNSLPVTTTASALSQKREAAKDKCWVDVGFYGGLIPGNKEHVQDLIDCGVFGIKAFMCPSGLDEFPGVGEAAIRSVLPKLKAANLPLLVHAELVDEKLPTTNMQNRKSYAQYLESRPDAWEVNAIELLIELAATFDAHVHIVHLSTEQALPRIAAAKSIGVSISIETCPHYLIFAAEHIADGATQFKCAPPIRTERNKNLLCEALASGLIDSIGSDHSPCPPRLKRLDEGDFADAWGGIAGLQLVLPVVWTAGQRLDWKFEQLAKWLSHNPARLVGLQNRKGHLASGFDADIVVWDPEAQFEVDPDKLFHRHDCSPYNGCRLTGVVHQTYVRGNLVFDKGKHSDRPLGELISRNSGRSKRE